MDSSSEIRACACLVSSTCSRRRASCSSYSSSFVFICMPKCSSRTSYLVMRSRSFCLSASTSSSCLVRLSACSSNFPLIFCIAVSNFLTSSLLFARSSIIWARSSINMAEDSSFTCLFCFESSRQSPSSLVLAAVIFASSVLVASSSRSHNRLRRRSRPSSYSSARLSPTFCRSFVCRLRIFASEGMSAAPTIARTSAAETLCTSSALTSSALFCWSLSSSSIFFFSSSYLTSFWAAAVDFFPIPDVPKALASQIGAWRDKRNYGTAIFTDRGLPPLSSPPCSAHARVHLPSAHAGALLRNRSCTLTAHHYA
mmetsp:Transcript_12806/g.39363  ORF Transcript_12806/g.39363 Transcript_12806/m.39363 type:complete len:312 (-) Transcript_12806:71-1006(-)